MGYKARALLVAIITSILIITGCQGQSRVGGEITQALIGSPNLLNPLLSSDAASREVEAKIFEGLVGFDENLQRVGVLAKSWEFSPDGTVWTFFLKEGVRWHDGEPFTAADVKFTFDTIAFEAQYPGPLQSRFSMLERVEMVDDMTVRFYLKNSFGPFLNNLGVPILPKHIYDPQVFISESYLSLADMYNHRNNWAPIGTGPWRFTHWQDAEIRLERFHAYHGLPKPYIESILFKIYPDLHAAVAALAAGQLDFLPGLPDETIQELEDLLAGEFNFFPYPDLSYDYLGYNFRDDAFGQGKPNPLQDPLVRQAFAYAIDRQHLVDQVLMGRGQVVNSHIPRGSWALPTGSPDPYNTVLAGELLEQAGWLLQEDGFRYQEGKRLNLTVTYADNPRQEKMANLIKANLVEVGLEVDLIKAEWSDFLNLYIYPGKYQVILFGWSLGVDPDAFSIFHSSQAKEGLNFGHYSNQQVDALLILGRNALRYDLRKDIYEQLQAELALDPPYLFLFSRDLTAALRKNILGHAVSPLGLIDQSGWYIKGE